MQISDHLDIGRDESDEAKVESLSSIHAVGDPLFVKVRNAPCTSDVSETHIGIPAAASTLARV